MTPAVAEAIESVLKLPPRERADLATRLIESLDEEVDEEVTAAWDAEIAHRIRELDAGLAEPIPWLQARDMILGLDDGFGRA
ncbi:MAG: addiction module protein [Armatimonadetes bacterium]|nr:addiction module protein [Armatimonadota bacterium]